ncbi:MAG: CAP domain-containing protein [Candidatus Aenigmatarchaeota archaeon]
MRAGILLVLFAAVIVSGCTQPEFAAENVTPSEPAVIPEFGPPPKVAASDIEVLIHGFVNQERARAGLGQLAMNQEVAHVARAHSQDMAENSYLSHEDLEGKLHNERLEDANITYYNKSAENLAEGTIVSGVYTVEGEVVSKDYRTEEELAQAMVEGWMESPGHRENIVTPGYDEAGTGVAVAPDNETYYFTQVFITRIECGYRGGPCCETPGYLPWCYQPASCTQNVCV